VRPFFRRSVISVVVYVCLSLSILLCRSLVRSFFRPSGISFVGFISVVLSLVRSFLRDLCRPFFI